MAEQGGGPPGNILPVQGLVEEVLGVPLMPGVPYEIRPGDPPDIRVTIHDMVAHVVQDTVGRKKFAPHGDGTYLSETQRGRLAASPEAQEVIIHARRHLIVSNNVAATIDQPPFVPAGADQPHTPRAMLQHQIGRALYGFIQRPHPPKFPPAESAGRLASLCSGLVIGSATATGKTVPMATLAERAGVGQPFHPEVDPEKQRMLLIVPSVFLLEEYMDPDNTLAQWLPELEFGCYYNRKKQTGGDIDIVVNKSVPEARASGAFDLSYTPLRFVDEGHHVDTPRIVDELGDLATGKLVLLTATPRRAKRYFVDVTLSTPRSAAEDSITRPVRILTYQFGPEEGAAEKLAAQLAARVISTGRQVGIYCRKIRGRPDAAQAREVARLVNASDIMLPESLEGVQQGDYTKVIAGVSGYKANQQAEADYRAGKLRSYVAIGMLGEGKSIPMGALIIIGPRFNQDEWDQIAGRLPRPLMGKPELMETPGIIIELQPREIPQGADAPLATTWRTYGFDDAHTIEQGAYIGPSAEEEALLADLEEALGSRGAEPGFSPAPGSGAGTGAPGGGRATPGPRMRLGRRAPRPEILDELSDLEEHLAPPVAVREVTIAPVDWRRFEQPAEGSKTLSELAAEYNVPELWLRRQLDMLSTRADLSVEVEVEGELVQRPVQISYVGVRNTDAAEEGARWDFDRWYGPDTVAYLDANPPVSLPDAKVVMDITDIAEMLGVTRQYLETIIARLDAREEGGLPRESHLGKTNRPTAHFRLPEITKMEAEATKTPVAGSTEVALADLAAETREGHVYNFVRARKNGVALLDRLRLGEDGTVESFRYAPHVDAETAARIRDAYFNPPLADPDEDISVVEMARRAEMTLKTMQEKIALIPEEERPNLYGRKTGPKLRFADHMNRRRGLEIVEQWRPYRLPPNRVTATLLERYFGTPRKNIFHRIDKLREDGRITEPDVTIRLGGQGGEQTTWTWGVMKALEDGGYFTRKKGTEPVDYDLVARGPYDPRWQYSQTIQEQFVDPKRLARMPAHGKMARTSGPEQLANPMEVAAYAASRNLRLQDVFAAVADDAVADAMLHYQATGEPGNPTYYLEGHVVAALDRHLRPVMQTEAVALAAGEVSVAVAEPAEPAAASAAEPPPAAEPPSAATPKQPPAALEPKEPALPTAPALPGRFGLAELVERSGRTAGAVVGAARQLGLEDDLARGAIRPEDAFQLSRLLGGGKPPNTPSVTPAADAPVAGAVPARAEQQTAATGPEDPTQWVSGEDAAATLGCSPAALLWLVTDQPRGKECSQRTGYTIDRIRRTLVPQLRQKLKSKGHAPDMWIVHDRLAENHKVQPEDLFAFMAGHGINIEHLSPKEYQVVPRPGSGPIRYDVMYSPLLQRRLLAATQKKPRSGK